MMKYNENWYELGYMDGYSGSEKSDNPFEPNTVAHNQYREGWYTGNEDRYNEMLNAGLSEGEN